MSFAYKRGTSEPGQPDNQTYSFQTETNSINDDTFLEPESQTQSMLPDPIKKQLYEYKGFIRLFFFIILYLPSLERCSETDKKCFDHMHNRFFVWGICLLISSYLFCNLIYEAFIKVLEGVRDKNTNKVTIGGALVLLATVSYLALGSLNPGFGWQSHGSLSRIFFNMFLILNILVIGSLKILSKIQDKYNSIGNLLYVLFFLSISFFLLNRILYTKDSFNTGFAGHTVENYTRRCHWRKISVNWYSAFDDLFWRFSHKHSDCNESWFKSDLAFVKKKFQTKIKGMKVMYPRAEDFDYDTRQHFHHFQNEFVKNIKLIKSDEVDPQHHSYLNLEDPMKPKLEINITRDEGMIAKKKELMKNNKELKKRPNVLVLLIDSLSRQHFFRKMPKTAAYFENYFERKEPGFEAYQFFRFHAVSRKDYPNLLTMRYDSREFWEALHPWHRFETNYKDEGWVTSTSTGKCEVNELDLRDEENGKKYPSKDPLDYEFYAAACDPNATPIEDPFQVFKGPFSEFRRCLYGDDSSRYNLDFVYDMWKKYPDMPKLSVVTLLDGHEFTGELPVYLDKHIPDFFEKMKKEGLLEDSITFLLSDHGNNANLLFKNTKSGLNELSNPFLMMMLSKNNADVYGKTLKNNEQKLLSMHDVNRVLNEIAGAKQEFVGWNYMLHEIEDDRTCGDANIPPAICRCIHGRKFRKNHHFGGDE